MFPLVVQFLPRIEKKTKQKMHSKVTRKLQLLASLQAGWAQSLWLTSKEWRASSAPSLMRGFLVEINQIYDELAIV